MSWNIDQNTKDWDFLLTNPDDTIFVGAFRIIPGSYDKKASQKYSAFLRSYNFHCMEQDYSTSYSRKDGYFDPCGQEVLAIMYFKKIQKRNILLSKRTETTGWLMSVIGLHSGHVIAGGGDYWKGSKKATIQLREELLSKLVMRCVERRSEFIGSFLPGGDAFTQQDSPM